ncbi:MAG TPA: oxidoreductase [Solirubrobacteraceae bacterium]|jgi:NAD(P)-dependent dehydrogenase (short-subunit alcohol dehydrogenase family)|nr:oxidoreductase [Solirubrobacteraceae bacterium]
MAAGWTAAQIPDQTGRRAVVTGANGGLGIVVAEQLARAGADVILACRDPDRGRAAAEAITTRVPAALIEVRRLDLADLGSIREFAGRLSAEPAGLDLLINNAGVMAPPRRLSADGFELQLATNHLGHFALTGLLLDPLLAAPAGRVVTVSSVLHRIGRIDFDDLQAAGDYRRWRAYGQSKLANLLFAFELDRRAREAGAGLASLAAHPGFANTNLQAASSGRLARVLFTPANLLFAQSAAAGALPILCAATADLPGGSYVGPDGPGERRGHPRLVAAAPAAHDPVSAERLWQVSEELTGVGLAFGGRSAAASIDR